MSFNNLLLLGNNYMLDVSVGGSMCQETNSMRYSVEFRYLGHMCDIKDGSLLRAAVGYGDSLDVAANDYYNKIKGKTLVCAAYSAGRREITIE